VNPSGTAHLLLDGFHDHFAGAPAGFSREMPVTQMWEGAVNLSKRGGT
jgi:hypothetical protein